MISRMFLCFQSIPILMFSFNIGSFLVKSRANPEKRVNISSSFKWTILITSIYYVTRKLYAIFSILLKLEFFLTSKFSQNLIHSLFLSREFVLNNSFALKILIEFRCLGLISITRALNASRCKKSSKNKHLK